MQRVEEEGHAQDAPDAKVCLILLDGWVVKRTYVRVY